MNTTVRLRLSPRDAGDDERLRKLVAKAAGVNEQDISGMRIIRSSIDARRRDVIIDREIQVFSGEEPSPAWEKTVYQSVGNKKPVIIVGSGPAGLFCALRLLEIGIRPIVLERGNDVEQRKLDIARMVRSGRTNPESNYGFGEGGAGAFSDGKAVHPQRQTGGCLQGALPVLSDGSGRINPLGSPAAHRLGQVAPGGGGNAQDDHRLRRGRAVRPKGHFLPDPCRQSGRREDGEG
ncbi:MAG: FAD-dependent monooxygenase [Sphaerochaeta sp.]|nr:FAD-dependent monooxygenase [Sphaerochaeta sp.]